jgi:hypothetical protein
MSHNAPSTSVRKLPSGAGLILLDTSANCLWAYNDSARQVWEVIERGGSDDDIVADLTDRYGIPDEVARADASAILSQWRTHGLVRPNGEDKPQITVPATATDWTTRPEPRSR